MDSFSTYDDIPWDLITASLQDDLPEKEAGQLEEWISLAPDNRERYVQLRRIWEEETADYLLYRDADEEVAWQSLWKRIGNSSHERERATVIRYSFRRRVMRRLAVAATLLLVAGTGYWYFSGRSKAIVYATNDKEQKTVSLPDGSTIILKPKTHIQLAGDYNKGSRTVILTSGEASFNVQHRAQLPFVVSMDIASVKDIGTDFTVQRGEDSIKVRVSGGKVAFVNNVSGEARELSAGMALSFSVHDRRFGAVAVTSAGSVNYDSANFLKFSDMPLSEVLPVLQKEYGRTIRLNDTSIGQKRLTANLDRESFENAMKVICASFNLEYTEKKGVYLLKKQR